MNFEQKVKELMEHIDLLVDRFVVNERSTMENSCDTITHQEGNVISTVGRHGPSMMSDIADRLSLSLSSVTGIVDKLVEKKLVERERSEEDRRIVRVVLTAEGQEVVKSCSEGHLKIGRGMLGALNDVEQDALLGLFRKISGTIQKIQEVSTSR